MHTNNIVFDFDETIISKNSFPLWVAFLTFKAATSCSPLLLIKVIWLLFKRKVLGTIGHGELKRQLVTMETPEAWDYLFSIKLLNYVRAPIVSEVIRHLDGENKVIISSAAPEKYLRKTIELILSNRHSQVTILGAKVIDGCFDGNHKERKLHNLCKLLRGSRITALYTDSWDDRFLASASEKVFLVSPRRLDVARFMNDQDLKNKIVIFDELSTA